MEAESLFSEEIGEYSSYGIGIYRGSERVARISDVPYDRNSLAALCEKCSTQHPELIHIYDIIEDFLE